MIPILLIFGGVIVGMLGTLHGVYTLLDLRKPRRLVLNDPSVVQAMADTSVRVSRGATDMWRAWIGFNFTHSLGLVLFAAVAIWSGARIRTVPTGLILALALIGCIYLVLAVRYFFRIPAIGIAVATGCFAIAWILSLR